MKIGHAINYREDSDSAVLSYIEGLLSEAPVDAGVAVDTSAQPAQQGFDNNNSLEAEPAITSNIGGAADLGVQQTTVIPVAAAAANSPPESAVLNVETVKPASASQALDPTAAPAELEEGEQLTANNPFLKQLEAAQRRGRGKALPGNATRVDNRPLWGRQDFICLSFKVSGLKLAIPMHFIEGMQPLDLSSTPPEAALAAPVKASRAANRFANGLGSDGLGNDDLGNDGLGNVGLGNEGPGNEIDTDINNAAIMLGQMTVTRPNQSPLRVDVVDTARLVMPERYDVNMLESYRYVLVIKNCDWCIAVDSIGGELALGPQNVRWRSEHTRREWLAGTVVDKMCALVDIDVLNRQILADQVLNRDD